VLGQELHAHPLSLLLLKKLAIPVAIKAKKAGIIGAGLASGAVVGTGLALGAKGLLAAKVATGAGIIGSGIVGKKILAGGALAGAAGLAAKKAAVLGGGALIGGGLLAAPLLVPKGLLLSKGFLLSKILPQIPFPASVSLDTFKSKWQPAPQPIVDPIVVEEPIREAPTKTYQEPIRVEQYQEPIRVEQYQEPIPIEPPRYDSVKYPPAPVKSYNQGF